VPPEYAFKPEGGGESQRAVLACKRPDGLYDIFDLQTGARVMTAFNGGCMNFFENITMADEGDSRCGAPPTGGGDQTGPEEGACSLPTDKKFIMCPPSNGITANYYLDALTGRYADKMTTQSPECANQSNVIQVAANSPYCGGSEVSGPGSDYPSLVACFKRAGQSFEEAIVDIHNGPDYALLASDVMLKDIPARFPGRRWIFVNERFCSALPDFGIAPAAAEPAPPPPAEPIVEEAPPPTVEDQPSYEAGPPVLPPPSDYTMPAMPTGAFPGAPFPAMPQQPMKAIAPAPMPEPCPLGPVPIARWANDCAMSKLNQ
jgi:hypothetical protein